MILSFLLPMATSSKPPKEGPASQPNAQSVLTVRASPAAADHRQTVVTTRQGGHQGWSASSQTLTTSVRAQSLFGRASGSGCYLALLTH